nr:MAG TPA: hypothetical protein [Caudoviricetes sp.]
MSADARPTKPRMVFVWPSQRIARLSSTPFWNPERAVL